jgi:outer membrane protein OmpA-like peptidoglycan-associated protein
MVTPQTLTEESMRPTTLTALTALALGFALCAPALAQDPVTVFEDAPSIEQLRSILIPDAGPGQSRKIELYHGNDTGSPPAATPAPAPAPQATQAAPSDYGRSSAGIAAAPRSPALRPAVHPKDPEPASAAVAFRINFASGSDAIPTAYYEHLDRIVGLMTEAPKLALTVEGHTDAHGSAEYNLELSKRRAVSVMRYLVAHGVDASRLIAVGKGKTAPMTADPYDGRNRRVQFVNGGEQAGT